MTRCIRPLQSSKFSNGFQLIQDVLARTAVTPLFESGWNDTCIAVYQYAYVL